MQKAPALVRSMTGFASVSRESALGAFHLELRSVNSRYLDLIFRMSEELRVLEGPFREAIGARLSRGKVECRFNYTPPVAAAGSLEVNEALIAQLAGLNGLVLSKLPEARPLTAAEVLRWPGVIVQQGVSQEALQAEALALMESALEELAATRAREGDKLKAVLLDRAAAMEALVEGVKPKVPELVAGYREKLLAAFREAGVNGEEERLRQEITLFAQRIDVAEEIARLETHLVEVRRVLKAGGAVGKRLDFLMQELNREANTLASKSAAADSTAVAVELKVIIEQMREQVQNIE